MAQRTVDAMDRSDTYLRRGMKVLWAHLLRVGRECDDRATGDVLTIDYGPTARDGTRVEVRRCQTQGFVDHGVEEREPG